MNKQRKQRFEDVVGSLEEAKDILSDIRGEEQDAFDAMPEGLQVSERGDKMQYYIDLMDDCDDKIDDIITFVNEELLRHE